MRSKAEPWNEASNNLLLGLTLVTICDAGLGVGSMETGWGPLLIEIQHV